MLETGLWTVLRLRKRRAAIFGVVAAAGDKGQDLLLTLGQVGEGLRKPGSGRGEEAHHPAGDAGAKDGFPVSDGPDSAQHPLLPGTLEEVA